MILQIEDGLWSHTEQEVEDGKIWQETMLVLEHLPILFGGKVRVRQRVFGVNDITEVMGDG